MYEGVDGLRRVAGLPSLGQLTPTQCCGPCFRIASRPSWFEKVEVGKWRRIEAWLKVAGRGRGRDWLIACWGATACWLWQGC
jgi:hypothetical protein